MEMVITLEGKAKVKAHYKGHVVVTDQPEPSGDNSAPAPFDLFLASIGTCAGIYVKSFCDQRSIPTDEIKLVQTLEFDPVKRLVAKINLQIKLPPDFPEKYRAAVVNAAELCAVKKHLHNPPVISVTSLVEATD